VALFDATPFVWGIKKRTYAVPLESGWFFYDGMHRVSEYVTDLVGKKSTLHLKI
jgi:hypothetical protein